MYIWYGSSGVKMNGHSLPVVSVARCRWMWRCWPSLCRLQMTPPQNKILLSCPRLPLENLSQCCITVLTLDGMGYCTSWQFNMHNTPHTAYAHNSANYYIQIGMELQHIIQIDDTWYTSNTQIQHTERKLIVSTFFKETPVDHLVLNYDCYI